MRICLVTHCFPHTDGDLQGSWIPQFIEQLRRREHHVSVVTPRMHIEEGQELKRDWPFEVRYFKWAGGVRRLGQLTLYHPKDIRALWDLLRRGRMEVEKSIDEHSIDLCLGVWAIPSGYFCFKAKQRLGTPYAVWSLGSDMNVYGRKRLFRKTVSNVLKHADHLFANSNQLIQDIEKLVNVRECIFMPTNRILPQVGASGLELNRTTTNFLYIGRLEHVKGIDILVDAMIRLCRKGREASLYVVGDGSMKSDLMARVRKEGIGQRVNFEGPKDPRAVVAYLKACDVLVIPSRSEGMPVVYWEAMQTGTPVIVTDAGDMARHTHDFQVGKVVPREDAASLRQAMEEFMDGSLPIKDEDFRKLAKASSLETAADTFLNTVLHAERT